MWSADYEVLCLRAFVVGVVVAALFEVIQRVISRVTTSTAEKHQHVLPLPPDTRTVASAEQPSNSPAHADSTPQQSSSGAVSLAKRNVERDEDEQENISRPTTAAGAAPPDLREEMLVRNIQFFGDAGQKKVQKGFVIVVGVGGVGSHCACTLARSGVGKIRIVDFDLVSLSSLNRHAVATLQSVGTQKVLALKKAIHAFNPYCEVDAVQSLFSIELADELLLKNGERPDYIVDCIDNIKTKCDLLEFCVEKKIPVIASGGSAAKCDPTKLHIATLENTVECELARAVRNELKDRRNKRSRRQGAAPVSGAENMGTTPTTSAATGNTTPNNGTQKLEEELSNNFPGRGGGGDEDGEEDEDAVSRMIMFVYSTERTSRGLMPLKDHQQQDPNEFAPLQNFRVRVLPVIAPIPSIFGNMLACYVLCQLADQQAASLLGVTREPLKRKAWRRFIEFSKKIVRQETQLVKPEVAELLLYEVYRSKGVIKPKQIGQNMLVPVAPEVIRALDGVAGGKNDGGVEDHAGAARVTPSSRSASEEDEGSTPGGVDAENPDVELEAMDLFGEDAGALYEDPDDGGGGRFWERPENWILVSGGECERIVNWCNPPGRNWDGPLPDFMENAKVRERILAKIEEARAYLAENL